MKATRINRQMLTLGIFLTILCPTGCSFDREKSGELDRTLVSAYWQATASGDYASAYNLLSNSYKKEVSLDKFSEAHRTRREEFGPILEAKCSRIKSSYNIFTRRHSHQMLYEIEYPDKTWSGYVVLEEEEADSYKIEGTYAISAGSSLRFVVW